MNVIGVTATDGPRSFPVTIWYPTAAGPLPARRARARIRRVGIDLRRHGGAARGGRDSWSPRPTSRSPSANSEWLDRGDVVNQAADISALITELTEPTTVPAALRGMIAPGPVGVIGHSDGGITAAAVAYNSSVADHRVGAAVILSGAEIMYDGPWFTTASPPLLAIHGDADEVNPYWSQRAALRRRHRSTVAGDRARRRAPGPVHHRIGRAHGRGADRRLPPRAAPARCRGRRRGSTAMPTPTGSRSPTPADRTQAQRNAGMTSAANSRRWSRSCRSTIWR